MVRSIGIMAAMVGLTWTGLAGAQSTSQQLGSEAAPPRFMTVREEGKAPQRCQLLKSWREPNGQSAFQVRAVDSGEVMTIVGSTPAGGDPRSLSTRIFHWNGENKSPAGAPLPPPTATVIAPPAPPIRSPSPRATANLPAQPPVTVPPAPTPQPFPATLTARTPDRTPAPQFVQTPAPTPTPPVVAPNPPPLKPLGVPPVVSTNPPALTPMGTQVIPQKLGTLPPPPPTVAAQPRLTPLPSGTALNPTPCDCACPSPCTSTCKPCDTCCQQPSCVCCPPSPLRQPFLGRLFKSKSCCVCTETVCPAPTAPAAAAAPSQSTATPPAPAVVKAVPVPTAPPAARDSRESWGKVEPWKASPVTSAKPLEKPMKRADPVPVVMEKSPQPSPIQDPALYRDMAMNTHIKNSKIVESKPVEVVPPPLMNAKAGPEAPPPTARAGRSIELPANEANAFWTPPTPPKPAPEPPKSNAFERGVNDPPSANQRVMVNPPQGPVPPRGPMPLMAPRPPMPPSMPADMGVPDAMANAFTLAGTRRPIPADFGGTPQEPNGFGDNVPQPYGQGSPPRAYGMAMPSGPRPPMMMPPRPPMPNAMAMNARMPVGMNPLMNVPPTPKAVPSAVAAATPKGVPQLLATLKDSLLPSEREWAAEQLSGQNGRANPQVVQGLMASAKDDPAATVRAASVRALAQMKVGTKEVAALVQNLKTDRDPRVRQEAEEASETLGLASGATDTGIRPVSHR